MDTVDFFFFLLLKPYNGLAMCALEHDKTKEN